MVMNWLLCASPIFLGKASGQLTTHKNGKGLGERNMSDFLRGGSFALALVIALIALFTNSIDQTFRRRSLVFTWTCRVSSAYFLITDM